MFFFFAELQPHGASVPTFDGQNVNIEHMTVQLPKYKADFAAFVSLLARQPSYSGGSRPLTRLASGTFFSL